MITLKAALIAASTVGTVAVGGGATWAMTASPQTDTRPSGAEAPAVTRQVPDAAPRDVPTCIPLDGRLPAGTVPKSDLPTCAPAARKAPDGVPAAKPSTRVPDLPDLPKLDCDGLKPAVPVGGTVEKAVMLPKGLRHVSTVPGSADLRKSRICAVTQKWTGRAGQWLTVETLKTPAGMTRDQLRTALGLPAGGTPVTIAGTAAWQAPGNEGVLLFDPAGHTLLINGSPTLPGGLKDVATALSRA